MLALILRAFSLGNLCTCLTSLYRFEGHVEGSILMVTFDLRTRFFPRMLLWVGVGLLLSLVPSQVGSGFLRFFKEDILLGPYLYFLRVLARRFDNKLLRGLGCNLLSRVRTTT